MIQQRSKKLDEVAQDLIQKWNFLNKKMKSSPEHLSNDASDQNDFEINSDSERQAMELFGNVRMIGDKEKKNKGKNHQNDDLTKPKSILRQQPVPIIEEKQDKKSKSVSFNFNDNLIFSLNPDRKWKDPIENQKKGKFQVHQQKILSDAVGQYLATNQITFEQFVKWLSVGSKEEKHILRKQKFFKLLSSVLPNRSPQSCYKYVIRSFHSFNHQGAWTADEIDRLLTLVSKFGRKWTLIGKELGRTSDNVYDKYRSLGQEDMNERVKNSWKFSQLTSMLFEIERQTGIQFLNHNLKKQLEKQDEHNQIQEKQLKERKYNSKSFTFHNIEILKKYIDTKMLQGINLQSLKWKKIVKRIKTRQIFDCRNKIVQILQILFRNNSSLDENLIKFLKKEKAQEQSKINWKSWKSQQYSAQQAKNRLMILKKLVQGRTSKPFSQIFQQIESKVKKLSATKDK